MCRKSLFSRLLDGCRGFIAAAGDELAQEPRRPLTSWERLLTLRKPADDVALAHRLFGEIVGASGKPITEADFHEAVFAGMEHGFAIASNVAAGRRTCRVCGCWELEACAALDGLGCWWVGPDLCSSCGHAAHAADAVDQAAELALARIVESCANMVIDQGAIEADAAVVRGALHSHTGEPAFERLML